MDFNQQPENNIFSIYGFTYIQDRSINNRYITKPDTHPWNPAKIGNGLGFDGVNDVVSIADSSSLSFGNSTNDRPFSISAWIYPTSFASSFLILDKVMNVTTQAEWFFYTNTTGNLGIRFYDLSSPNQIARGTNAAVPLNNWSHVTMVYNGNGINGITLFINGVNQTTTSATGGTYVAMHDTNANLEIGRIWGSDSSFIAYGVKGYEDELMVFNRTLNNSEVLDIYNNQSIGNRILETDASLVSYYKLDETNGTIASDTKNLNPGTLINYTADISPYWNSTAGYDKSGAYVFDGVNDYINTTALLGPAPVNNFAFSVWINQSFLNVSGLTILQHGQKYSGGTATSYIGLSIAGGMISFISRPTNFGAQKIINANTNITAGTWNHVVGVVDNQGIMNLYLNGMATGTPTAVSVLSGHNQFTLGAEASDTGSTTAYETFFNGVIDQVQIFNRSLSANEVLNMYNGSINNSNYNGKYSNQGSFDSGFFYNSTSQLWRINLSVADTSSNRNGLVNQDNTINLSDLNLVSYWALDGNSLDSTGRNNGTAAAGNIGTNNASGISSSALFFDGNDDRIVIADSNSLTFGNGTNDGNFSISMWINAKSFSTLNWLISKRDAANEWQFVLSGGKLILQLFSGGGANYISRSYNTALNSNQWYYVTTTYNGSGSAAGINIYVNGVRLDDTSTSSGVYVAMSNTVAPVYIAPLTNGYYFNGTMDEILIYNKTLSVLEIQQLYKSGLSQKANTNISIQTRISLNLTYNVSDSGLVSFWNFNNDNTTRASDLMGRNNGTYANHASTNVASGVIGNGSSFDGTDDYISGTLSTSNSSMPFTVMAWVNVRKLSGGFQVPFRWGTETTGNIIDIAIGGPTGTGQTLSCDRWNGASIPYVVGINLNEWNHIACIYNGSAILEYVNGVYKGNWSGTLNISSSSYSIGGRSGASPLNFNGTVDEVRVYNRSLSGSEVLDIYNHGTSELSDLTSWSSALPITDGLGLLSSTNGKLMQFRLNLNSNDSSVSPYVLNYTVTPIPDFSGPSVTFVYPQNNYNYSINITQLNFTITDETGVSACWFSNNSGINNYSLSLGCLVNFTNLSFIEGRNNWTIYANDTLGQNSISNISFVIDFHAPNGTLNFPFNQSYQNASLQNYSANLSDNLGIRNATLNIYNSTNSLINSTIVSFTSVTVQTALGVVVNLVDGFYTWFYNLFDWAGNNFVTGNNTVTIDVTKPLIEYGTGTLASGVNVSQNFVFINVTVTEINEANITFRIYNSSWSNITTLSAGNRSINFTNISDGTYSYNVSVIDLSLNINNTPLRVITLDKTAPNGTLIEPIDGLLFNASSQNFTANLSDNIGIRNATLNIYNQSGFFNSTLINFIPGVTSSTIGVVVNLVDGFYTWFYNLFDWAGNLFITSNNTLTIDMINPTITDIVYSPEAKDNIDPNTLVAIRARVSDERTNISSVILEYYNGSIWNNESMLLISGNKLSGIYQKNITTQSAETNYTFRIFTNDSVNNQYTSDNVTFESFWDCSWIAYTDNALTTTMGTSTGFNLNKQIRIMTINNTGDYNYSLDYCQLRFSLSAQEYDGGFDYEIPVANRCGSKVCVNATHSVVIPINYSFGQIPSEFEYNFSVTASYFPSIIFHSLNAFDGTILTQQAGPYLTQEVAINDADGIIELTPQTLNFNAYIQNAMGDNSVNNSAYNVSSNWHIPSLEFTNLSEPLDYFYNNLSDDSQFLESLNLNFTDLENFNTTSAGKFYSFTLLSQGFQNVSANSENLTLINQSGTSLFNDTVKLFFKCYETSDGVKVWGCWPSDPDTVYCGNSRVDKTNGMNETCDDGNTISGDGCSSTCQIEPSTTTISSGGGGGGGGGSTGNEFIEQSNATFELLRGEKQEFSLEIRNKYSNPMSNVSVSVSGLNSEYISISPKVIDYIPGLGSRNVTVKINAPAYFNGKKYMLIFDISGKITINNTSYPIQNKKSVTLYILEVSRTDSILYLNESAKFLREMISFNMSTKEISILIEQEKKAFVAISFTELKAIHEKIKLIYTNAMGSKAIMDELSAGIIASEKQGITVSESKKLLYLGQIAFNRGDYALAIQRLQQAKLVYALEIKGEFNLFYTIKNKPLQSLGVILLLGFFGVGSTLLIRYRLYKNKLKILGEEELLLLELMKMIQRQCFEENRMSMEEYNSAMNQYENKLSETVADKIRIETKLANMFKLKGKKMALDNERKILLTLIMKIQDDYMNKKQMETRIYENMLKSYSGRLSEVDEQLAFLEAQDAVAHQVKSRGFFKK